MEAYLLAAVAYHTAGANWQRGGGKGPRPRPVKPPRPTPRRRRRGQGVDVARRLARLGLLDGRKVPPGPAEPAATAREQLVADQVRRALRRHPSPDRARRQSTVEGVVP